MLNPTIVLWKKVLMLKMTATSKAAGGGAGPAGCGHCQHCCHVLTSAVALLRCFLFDNPLKPDP